MTLNNQRQQMKETEKLDLILHEMYLKKSEGRFVSISAILEEPLKAEGLSRVQIMNEADRLGELLRLRGYIQTGRNMNHIGRITSNGVMYCEQDSFSSSGNSLATLNLYQIHNSPNTNFVHSSTNTSISIDNSNQIAEKLTQLESLIEESVEITDDVRSELRDSLAEVKQAVEKGVSPKSALKYMLTLVTGAASLAELVQIVIQLLPK